VAKDPVPDYRRDLAVFTGSLGDSLNKQGDRAGSRRAFERSTALWEELAAQHTGVVFYRQRLALTQIALGDLLKDMGHWEEAADAYRKTLPVLEKLAHQFSKDANYRRNLAGTQNNLGLLLKDLGRPDEAEAAYRQALSLFEKPAVEFANEVMHAIDQSRTHCNLGHLVRDQGQPAAALEWYDQALRTLQPVLAGDARRGEARDCLRYLYSGRAEALARLGRHEEAVKDLDEALALAEGPGHPLLRARRALSRGAPAEAVAAVHEQVQAKAVSGSTLY
jgi:tetratricopeptide (TPR) repeat protein